MTCLIRGKKAAIQYAVVTSVENGTTPGDLHAEYDILQPITQQYYNDIYILLIVNTTCMVYFIKDLQELIYCSIRGVIVKQITLSFVTNFLTFIMVAYWNIKHWGEYTKNVNLSIDQNAYVLIQRMESDSYFSVNFFTAFLTTFQFLRLIV